MSNTEQILGNVDLVPGTEIMTDLNGRQFAKSRHKHIVLIPQPSGDPRDPLTWKPLWKFAAIATTMFVTFVQNLGPLAISPIFPQLIEEFDSSLEEVIQFTGITILLLAFGNWLWVPLCDTFGRRSVLILSEVVAIVGAIWRATASSYSSFYGASALLGIGTGVIIQPTIIADVMFLHERGFYNTLFFAMIFCSITLGPILQGVMAQNIGWRSFWWLITALNGLGLIVVILVFPETAWPRKPTLKTVTDTADETATPDARIHDNEKPVSQSKQPAGEYSVPMHDKNAVSGSPSIRQFWPFQPHPRPFQQLLLSCWIPFKLFTFPIIVWAALVQAWASSCFLAINLVQSSAFGAPPYNFSTQSIGFTNFAVLVGALVGLFTAGPLSDWVSMKLTVRNGGIREAEMRLPTMIPYVLIMLLGNFVVAFGLEYGWDWRAIVIIGFGSAGVQATALSSIATTYAVDAYKPASTPIFIVVTLARDLWGYGVSHWFEPWVAAVGYVSPFMLNMCLLALWILGGGGLYFFGKRVRRYSRGSWVHRYGEATVGQVFRS